MLIFGISLFLSLVAMSFIEHAIHRWLMHRKRLPSIVYRLFPFLLKVFEQHTFLHHRKYYETFNYEPDPYGRDLDITLSIPLSIAMAIPVCFGLWFLSPISAGTFMGTVIGHNIVWNAVHSEMHRPKQAWFSKTRVYKYLTVNHWMHHAYPGKNFNVVLPPVADMVMGTYLLPSDKDQERMRQDGI
jgi:hypothetical protein